MEELTKASCVRGYHIYKEIWRPVVVEESARQREMNNGKDRYSVAVKEGSRVVGHLTKKISRVCSQLLRRGGITSCITSGTRRYSADLDQGGLEIPCN